MDGLRAPLPLTARSVSEFYRQPQAIGEFPQSLITLEVLREAATILVLLSVAVLSSAKRRSRAAIFLWTFAIWDIVYYAGLWATVRWPPTLRERDVLFLIPVPWFAPVWFPLLVSALALLAVLLTRVRPPRLVGSESLPPACKDWSREESTTYAKLDEYR